jgi:hypothetical protein
MHSDYGLLEDMAKASANCSICGKRFAPDNPVWTSDATYSTKQSKLNVETHVNGVCRLCAGGMTDEEKVEVIVRNGEIVLSIEEFSPGMPLEMMFEEDADSVEMRGIP